MNTVNNISINFECSKLKILKFLKDQSMKTKCLIYEKFLKDQSMKTKCLIYEKFLKDQSMKTKCLIYEKFGNRDRHNRSVEMRRIIFT